MSVVTMTPSLCTVIKPKIINDTTFFFDTTELAAFQGVTISAGSSLRAVFGANLYDLPILAWGAIQPIDSYNIYIQTTPSGATAEAFQGYLIPVWYADEFPIVGGNDELYYHRFSPLDGGTNYITRTHAASATQHDTLTHGQEDDGPTVIAGGGSDSTDASVVKASTCNQYMQIDIEAGATDDVALDTLRIWGTYRRRK